MNVDQVLNEFKKSGALLEGHFILSSGLHSDKFLQKALVFQDAKRTAKLCKALAAKVKKEVKDEITAIVRKQPLSPARSAIQSSKVLPPILWRTFGSADFMRSPRPAARMIAARCGVMLSPTCSNPKLARIRGAF